MWSVRDNSRMINMIKYVNSVGTGGSKVIVGSCDGARSPEHSGTILFYNIADIDGTRRNFRQPTVAFSVF